MLKWIFRCPKHRSLLLVWREATGEYGLGQTETLTKIYIGRYILLRWTTIHTNIN